MMHINAFLQTVGHHESAWRLPEVDVSAPFRLSYWQELARTAERGCMDSVFFGDTPSLPLGDIRYRPGGRMDPFTLVAALAATTSDIGLIGTASTSYNSPYSLARQMATLDHISEGRVGWNIVTSGDVGSARNYGLDEPEPHEQRYAKATEFVDVVLRLWDSWDDAFLVDDKEEGIYADGTRIRELNHAGTYFKVAGPLNLPRPPQGHPVLVQAGTSSTGRQFAASFADIVFTAMQSLDEAIDFYQDLKRLVSENGRDPDSCKVLPGLVPFIGSTEEEAQRMAERLLTWQNLDSSLQQLNSFLNWNLDASQLDRHLLDVVDRDKCMANAGNRSRAALILDLATEGALTVRETLHRMGAGRGHQVVVGTPEQIADHMEKWYRGGAADGFNIMPPTLPQGLDDFVDQVTPILQQRGLFRSSYQAGHLRDRLGLARPGNTF